MMYKPGPVLARLFTIRIKIRFQLNILLLWIFLNYYNYSTID